MLITQREAAARLGRAGLTRRHARRVLGVGFAGEPVRTSSALLYDEDLVRSLVTLPEVEADVMETLSEAGLFVARRDVDVTAPWNDQAQALLHDWSMSPWTWVWLRSRIQRNGGWAPFVATVAGFVAMGADLADIKFHEPPDKYRLELRPPGCWYKDVRDRRLVTGPGRPWMLPGWPYPGSRSGVA